MFEEKQFKREIELRSDDRLGSAVLGILGWRTFAAGDEEVRGDACELQVQGRWERKDFDLYAEVRPSVTRAASRACCVDSSLKFLLALGAATVNES